MKNEHPEILTLDVRPLLPSYRHTLIFFILEKLAEINAPQILQVISEHKPVGMEIELKKKEEIKGKYHLNYKKQGEEIWMFQIKHKEEP